MKNKNKREKLSGPFQLVKARGFFFLAVIAMTAATPSANADINVADFLNGRPLCKLQK